MHPDVFVFLRNASAPALDKAVVSDILLSSRSPALGAVSGYTSHGNLFTGSGYWTQQTDMPVNLSDLRVRLRPQVSSVSEA